MEKTFKEFLDDVNFKDLLNDDSEFKKIMKCFDEILYELTTNLPVGVKVWIEHSSSNHHSFKFMIGTKDGDYNNRLFSFYIDPKSERMSFDFIEKKLTKINKEEQSIFKLISEFLSRPTTIAQIHHIEYIYRMNNKGER